MKLIPLSKGKFAQVDDEDFDRVNEFKWTLFESGRMEYAYRTSYSGKKGKTIFLHRFILSLTDPKKIIDHIDHNGLNDQKNNLRICDITQNSRNRRSKLKATSRFLGVGFCKGRKNPWQAQIKFEGKNIFLGRHFREEDAAKAYNDAAKKYFGEFANLNTF